MEHSRITSVRDGHLVYTDVIVLQSAVLMLCTVVVEGSQDSCMSAEGGLLYLHIKGAVCWMLLLASTDQRNPCVVDRRDSKGLTGIFGVRKLQRRHMSLSSDGISNQKDD